VCDLETSRICTPYIYDIRSLRVQLLCMLDGFDGVDQAVGEHRASPRSVGAPGRLIIWHPSNRHFSSFFGLGQSRKIFLTARVQNADNLRRSCFARGELGSINTIFPISPVTS
jgi:hypothetical protein